jgi:hypothetical protein
MTWIFLDLISCFPGSVSQFNVTFHYFYRMYISIAGHAMCLPKASAAAISSSALCLIAISNSANLSHKRTVRLESSDSLVFSYLGFVVCIYHKVCIFALKPKPLRDCPHNCQELSLGIRVSLLHSVQCSGRILHYPAFAIRLIWVSTAPGHDPDKSQKISVS